jgi:hypothetical protein
MNIYEVPFSMMADAGAAAPLACTDVPPLSSPETVALAGGGAGLQDARWHRCSQACSQPSRQRSSRYAALWQSHCAVAPGDTAGIPGRAPSTGDPSVHRPLSRAGWQARGSYAHAGSAEGIVAHSRSLVMHVAVHKTARVTCSGWPSRTHPAFRAGRVRPGRGVVPPEWEECGGHQAGAKAGLAE